MSDIPRLAAELAERMESLGYSKGIVRIIWRERWNRREVSHTRYTIRIKTVGRMLAIHQGREPLWSQTPKPQIVSNDSETPDDIRKFYLQKAARVINVHHLRYTLRQACDILTASGRLRCRCDKIFGLATLRRNGRSIPNPRSRPKVNLAPLPGEGRWKNPPSLDNSQSLQGVNYHLNQVYFWKPHR